MEITTFADAIALALAASLPLGALTSLAVLLIPVGKGGKTGDTGPR